MKIIWRSRITVFILSFLVYIALTDIKDYQEVIAAVIISLLVSLVAGNMLITTDKTKSLISRIIAGIKYFFILSA